MDIKQHIENVVTKVKGNKVITTEFNGHTFNIIIIHVTIVKGSPIPIKFLKKFIGTPTMILWIGKDETFYVWLNTVTGEFVGKIRQIYDPDLRDKVMYLNPYFCEKFSSFCELQALSLISGQYWLEHTKFIDVFSEDTYIIKIYRDRYTMKRCRVYENDFEWYFYIKTSDFDEFKTLLDKADRWRLVKKFIIEGPWSKIYAHKVGGSFRFMVDDGAKKINQVIEGKIPTFEFDVSLEMRYAIDNSVKVDTNLNIGYYDIETDDTSGEIVIGRDRILSIAIVDKFEKEYYYTSKNENTILTNFIEKLREFDIAVGFNNYNFDDEYVIKRCREHQIYFKFHHRDWRMGSIDFQSRIRGTFGRMSGLTSMSLDNISKHFLGYGKIDRGEKVIDLYDNNPKKLKEYNIHDCVLLRELDKKLSIVDLMLAMCEWTGSFPTCFWATKNFNGISVSRLLDMFILRYAKQFNVHYKTTSWDSENNEDYVGGLVLDAVPGLYKDVYILDFKSLYPSIIWTWRISPENAILKKSRFKTVEEKIKSVNGIHFWKNKPAVFPKIVEDLMAARKKYKKMMFDADADSIEYKKYEIMQLVAKELTNALYGQLGQKGNRYYNHQIAGAITTAGRMLLSRTKELCEGMGIKVIYGDTDSVFITELGDKNINDVLTYLNQQLTDTIQEEYNIDDSIVELEYEKKMERFILIKKKNYVGLLKEQDGKAVDKVLVKGLEYVRKSTTDLAKNRQKELIELALREDFTLEHYIDWVMKIKNEFFESTPTADQLKTNMKVTKNPKEYQNKQPHVRVAEWLINNKKEFYEGMFIPYIITDFKNKKEVHADYYKGEFDRQYYWERIYLPVQRLLKVMFPDHEWGLYDDKQKEKIERRKKREEKAKEKLNNGRFIIKKTIHTDLFGENCKDLFDDEFQDLFGDE